MTDGLLALAHIDFYTARRILAEVIDGAYALLDKDRDKGERVVLVQNWPTAQRLHSKHGKAVVMIVCMEETVAELVGATVIDVERGGGVPAIDCKKIEAAKAKNAPLRLPCVNLHKLLIDREIDHLQATQILSHYNTFLYSCPSKHHMAIKRAFVDWLAGGATEDFLEGMDARTNNHSKLAALVAFMTSPRGATYQEVFTEIFAGGTVAHDLPDFEVAYMTRLRDKLLGE